MSNNDSKCPFCEYILPMRLSVGDKYANLYGRICPNCQSFIESSFENPQVKKNKLIKQIFKNKCLERLRKMFWR